MTDLRMNIKYSDDYSTVDKDLTYSEVTVDGVEYYKFVYEGVNPQRMYDEYKVTVSANDNGIPHYRTETKGVKSYIYIFLFCIYHHAAELVDIERFPT